MSIQIGPTDIVKLETLKDEISTGMLVSGTTGTRGSLTTTGTYYTTDAITKSVDGIITSLTVNSFPADKVYSYSFNGSSFTYRLKGTSASTMVRAGFTVTYQPFNYVWGLKNSTGDWLWRKAKPYTINFGTGVGKVIVDNTLDGSEEEITTSGTTVNLFYGGEYEIYGIPSSSAYKVDISQFQNIDLSEQTAESTPFSPSKFNSSSCNISSCTHWTMKIPAKTNYISSANVTYVYDGVTKTVALTSTTQTVNVDFDSEVYYSSITPVSGWTANYISSYKFKPNKLNYELPALKARLKDPTISLTVEEEVEMPGRYTCFAIIKNSNPTDCWYQILLEKQTLGINDSTLKESPYWFTISKNSSSPTPASINIAIDDYTTGSGTIQAAVRFCIYNKNGVALSTANTTDFENASTIRNATLSYGSTST